MAIWGNLIFTPVTDMSYAENYIYLFTKCMRKIYFRIYKIIMCI